MSTVRGRAHVGPDGLLHITLPGVDADTSIEYTLEFHPTDRASTGQPSLTQPLRSGQQRRDSLRRLAGSIDDPTFVRPPQGEFETRERVD